MAAAKALSPEEITSLTKAMADLGVGEFTCRGLTVKFDPLARARMSNSVPENFDLTKLDTAEAMERSKRANSQKDEDLFWSV